MGSVQGMGMVPQVQAETAGRKKVQRVPTFAPVFVDETETAVVLQKHFKCP